MKGKIQPMLFTWIPRGLRTGARTEDLAWLDPVLILLVAWLLLERCLTGRR